MKKVIRLTESDLHRIVKESTKKIITEMNDDIFGRVEGLKNSVNGLEQSLRGGYDGSEEATMYYLDQIQAYVRTIYNELRNSKIA